MDRLTNNDSVQKEKSSVIREIIMEHFYTNERNHQILIALLKAHNIKYVVASPGSCNSVFVGSIQNDPYFTIFSSVDRRSAAYIACGIAREKGEPVIVSCTGATATRNCTCRGCD